MSTIRISAGSVSATAELDDTVTARAVRAALPIRGEVSTWGDEIYFAIPVSAAEEHAQATVGAGDVAYWPPGSALCIFWGPTPGSGPDEIRPASPVNVVGRIQGDPSVFRTVQAGTLVLVASAGPAQQEGEPVNE